MPEAPSPTPIPRHVGIIMDGNGRWAKQRGGDRMNGHTAGSDRVRPIVRLAAERNVEFLSLFSFSSENWKRPKEEVEALLLLHASLLRKWRQEMVDDGVRFHHIGDREPLPTYLLDELDATVEATAQNDDIHLGLGMNYSGRDDIVAAIRRLAEAAKRGEISPDAIDETMIANSLTSSAFPDIDLLIRTSGEHRISNFMLWQLSYTEIVISPLLWPEFRESDFDDALRIYAERDRRFGQLSGSNTPN